MERDRADETRVLPRYRAAAVPFSLSGMVEEVGVDTFWEDHSHPTHELVWNLRGASEVRVDNRTWTITPKIGLWLPAGTVHSAYTPAGTQYRATQFGVQSARVLADGPVSVGISELLRLLLARLDDTGLAMASRGLTEAMVSDVMVPTAHQFDVPLPTSELLMPLAETLLRDPAHEATLEDWAQRLGVSSRTVARAFHHETGLSFSGWLTRVKA